MRRASALGLVFPVAVGAAAIAWFALRDKPELPDDPASVEVASTDPAVGTLDPARDRARGHEPWPFKEFVREFDAIRQADEDSQNERKLGLENEVKVYHELVDVDFTNATMDEVIQNLSEQLKYTGVKIFTIPNGDMDFTRFTLQAKDVEVDALISQLIAASKGRLYYFMTSQGLCLASQRGIERAQIDAREALAKRKAAPDRDDPILATQFRPDFADAWIGPIVRNLHEQTGVQVVADAAMWLDRRTLTWRADQMSLRDALDRICAEFHCTYRVRGGRVFLMQP
jgi:hypothetical protein